MFYEPKNGHGLPHDPFKAIVAPRPIGWISTRNRAGEVNLAPYSFFNAFSTSPFLVWFASDGVKDSVAFVRDSGEFVVNLVGRDLAAKMNASSVNAPRGVSEFGYAGLEPAPRCWSRRRASPARRRHSNARLTEIFEPKDLEGRDHDVKVVAGEVVGIHIDDAMLTDGLFDVVKAGNVARLGYLDFSSVTRVFSMRRPRWKRAT